MKGAPMTSTRKVTRLLVESLTLREIRLGEQTTKKCYLTSFLPWYMFIIYTSIAFDRNKSQIIGQISNFYNNKKMGK